MRQLELFDIEKYTSLDYLDKQNLYDPNCLSDPIFKEGTSLENINFESEHVEYIGGMFPKGRLSALVGDGACGKSFVAIAASLSITASKLFLPKEDYELTDTGKVLIVETENRIKTYAERIVKLGGNRLKYCTAKDPFETLDFSIKDDLKAIERTIETDNIDLVIVDGLAGFSSVDENSSFITPCIKWLSYIAQKYNCAIVFTHFVNKGELINGKYHKKSLRGHSSIQQFPQIIWVVDVPDTEKDHIKRLYQIKNNTQQTDKNIYTFSLTEVDNKFKIEFVETVEVKTKKQLRESIFKQFENTEDNVILEQLILRESDTSKEALTKWLKRRREKSGQTEGVLV